MLKLTYCNYLNIHNMVVWVYGVPWCQNLTLYHLCYLFWTYWMSVPMLCLRDSQRYTRCFHPIRWWKELQTCHL